MTMTEGITLICTVVGLGAGGLIWVVAAMMAPIKATIAGDKERLAVIIENNTAAMRDIKKMVNEHDAMLSDHHTRLTVIETKHDLNHP